MIPLPPTDPEGNEWRPGGDQERVLHELIGHGAVAWPLDGPPETEAQVDLTKWAETKAAVILKREAAAALADGLTVSTTGSVEMPETLFAVDVEALDRLLVLSLAALAEGQDGDRRLPIQDAAGGWHYLPAPQWRAVVGALAFYAAQLGMIVSGNPLGVKDLPDNRISLSL